MNSESELIITIWERVKPTIPTRQQLDVAVSILKAFEDYGFESKDIQAIVDEDTVLSKAYEDLYGGEEYEEDVDYYDDE